MRMIDRVPAMIGMWALGLALIHLMKRQDPNNNVYPVWAVFILISFTLFCCAR